MKKSSRPIKKYVRLASATKTVGFDVEIPLRYKIKEIYTINNKILELRLSSIVARKAKLTKNYNPELGISGAFSTGYPNKISGMPFTVNGIVGRQYWNSSAKRPKVYLAVWTDNGYAYSVYAIKGITVKKMAKWQANFK